LSGIKQRSSIAAGPSNSGSDQNPSGSSFPLLDERILEAAVEKAVQRLQAQNKDLVTQQSSLAQQLSEVETRKHRLVDAIARGEAIESLLTQLKAEEQQARLLEERIRALSNCEQVTSLNRKQLSEELKRRVADIRGLLSRHVSQARQMILKLVPQLDCTPFREGDEKGYRFSGDGSYGQLLSGETSPTKCGVPNRNVTLSMPHLAHLVIPFSGASIMAA
jgi:hypothetical protein